MNRSLAFTRSQAMLLYWTAYRNEKRNAGANVSLDEEDVMDCLSVTIKAFATGERAEPDEEKDRKDIHEFVHRVNHVLSAMGRPLLKISKLPKDAIITKVEPN